MGTNLLSILFDDSFDLNLSRDMVSRINRHFGSFQDLPLGTVVAINNNQEEFDVYCDMTNGIHKRGALSEVINSIHYKVYFPNLKLYGTVQSYVAFKHLVTVIPVCRIITKTDDASILLPSKAYGVQYDIIKSDHPKFMVFNNVYKCQAWLALENNKVYKPIETKIYYDLYASNVGENKVPKRIFNDIVNGTGIYRVGQLGSGNKAIHVIPLNQTLLSTRLL